ncbi:hypothetical protein NRA58_13295 [Acinetobacter baumannii]|uniref:hypothetical protein n=1 Tax=Acinetobacter baumannii TaxID=470 RepID=UPI0023426D36|nr:hypothetical protein [Acinetobacter baumannii]MDC4919644.1 hypothetical protein [Acinetobacter baumannii]MDC4934126.1 hypothetical protein [Acinetobacter baumannii]MDC5521382.1 hypothetical protein [Acinetobacter baumannii]
MFSISYDAKKTHLLDLIIQEDFNSHQTLDLGIEELPETLHFASDCASSVGSLSTTGGCIAGTTSSASTLGSMGSVVSTGG